MKPYPVEKNSTTPTRIHLRCRPDVLLKTLLGAISLPALLLFSTCRIPQYQNEPLLPAVPQAEHPKNVILLIGDGMALPQISAGLYWKGNGRSVFERFPVVGFHKSHSSDNLITDSAAGATAFACGYKSYNGAIGILDDETPCATIIEQLSREGFATGMVVTCSATHATPAAFIAHEDSRAFTDMIAMDYLHTRLDCYIGGGENYFDARPDKKNLLDTLRQRGYKILKGSSFKNIPYDGSAPFMQFTAPQEPTTAIAGRRYLPDATTAACNYLKNRNDKGFFLMVEGSQIDWALHANNANWLRSEMLDFDATILAALQFAAADGETLVLVTGDHECAGLSLNWTESRRSFEPKFAEHLHTAAMVPVLAYGPKAQLFSGVYDNTEIYYKVRDLFGF